MNNGNADGADNYYNNTWYNGYASYGMGIGSPMFPSPIYNPSTDTPQHTSTTVSGAFQPD